VFAASALGRLNQGSGTPLNLTYSSGAKLGPAPGPRRPCTTSPGLRTPSAVQQRNTATRPTDTAPERPPAAHDVRKQRLSTDLPAIRDEEAAGGGPVHREEHLDALTLPSQPWRCPRRHTPDRLQNVVCVLRVCDVPIKRVGVGAVASVNRARASLIQYRARSRSASALPAPEPSLFPSHSCSFAGVRRLSRRCSGAGHGRCRPETNTVP
jgi:hypothetical protein